MVSATPPASWFAPTINLSLKSGVPLVPSQSCQPTGMEAILPDQIIIEPFGRDNEPGVGTVLLTEFEDVELGGIAEELAKIGIEIPDEEDDDEGDE